MVPVQINDMIPIPFVLDSGASEVVIPADVLSVLRRTGTVKDSDFIGTGTYVLAERLIPLSQVGPNVVLWHVSFETVLGLASRHQPTSYWDIIGRDNPRKGVATTRRRPRHRKTATGLRQDSSNLPQYPGIRPAPGAPLIKP